MNRGRLYIVLTKKTSDLGTLLFGVAKHHRVARAMMFEQREQPKITLMLFNLVEQLLNNGLLTTCWRFDSNLCRIFLYCAADLFDVFRKGSRQQKRLPVLWQACSDVRHDLGKPHIEHTISLIENEGGNAFELKGTSR